MTILDIFVLAAVLTFGVGAVIYVEILARKAGRDRPHNPKELERFIKGPPYQRTGMHPEVLSRVQSRFNSKREAREWYRSAALASFDGRTPARLVDDGKTQQLLDYIEAVDAGVFS